MDAARRSTHPFETSEPDVPMAMQLSPSAALSRLWAGLNPAGYGRWTVALGYLLLSAMALYPLFSVTVPPLVDYPNHLARMHILATMADAPLLQERYAVEWAVLPNLAMDLVVPPLTAFMSVYDAGRVFVAATLLLIVAGTLALHRAVHGHVGLWPAAVYLFLYNHVLAWGFLNYLFGVGVFLLALAGWIASERWPAWARLALSSAASTALFFCHLFAFGAYGLTIVAYELGRSFRRHGDPQARGARNWAMALGQFVVPGVLWLISQGNTGISPGTSGQTFYGPLLAKLRALLSPTLFHWQPLDFLIFGFVCVVLMACLFGRTLRFAPALRLPLVVLGIAAVAMPTWLFNVAAVDFRLPVLLVCLLLAGTRIESRNREAMTVVATMAVVLFAARVWTMAETWRGYDQQFAEFREASQKIDEGARLLIARQPGKFSLNGRAVFPRAYSHLPALAVIDRSVFLPSLFTGPQQPIRASSAYASIDTPNVNGQDFELQHLRAGADRTQAERLQGFVNNRGVKAYWAFWPRNFDYVVMLDVEDPVNPFPGLLDPVHEGSFFAIYAIKKNQVPAW
jgi:hypothetical protein